MKSSRLGIISYDPNNYKKKLLSYLYNKIPKYGIVYADGMAKVIFDRNV